MLRSDIVFAILLILSIIDFAHASPVLVQEKGQAWVDAEDIPRDVITVLGKRGSDEVEKLAEELFRTWDKPVESSDAHASSSSLAAPPVPDHGSMNGGKAPAPNPASSPTNPEPLMEPLSQSGGMEKLMYELFGTLDFGTLDKPVESSGAHATSSSALPVLDHESMNDVKAPAPNPPPSPTNPEPLMEPLSPSPIAHSKPVLQQEDSDTLSESESDYEWLFDHNGEPIVPIPSPTSTEFDSDHELTEEHVLQPNTNPGSTSAGPDFDKNYWTVLEGQPPLKRPKVERRKIGNTRDVGNTAEDIDLIAIKSPRKKETVVGSHIRIRVETRGTLL